MKIQNAMSFYKKNKKIQYISITKNNNIEMFSMNMIKYSPPIKMTPPPNVLTSMSKDDFVKHLHLMVVLLCLLR